MRYYVYLLISFNLKKKAISYVGYTNNLKKRVLSHNTSKGAKFTKGRKWVLAYYKKYESKNIAMSQEYKLKKDLKLRAKIKNNFLNKKLKFFDNN